MAALVGLSVAGVEMSCAADGGWRVPSDVRDAENIGLLADSALSKAGSDAPIVRQTNAGSYDPYTCAANYGDTFCGEFERCMNAYGFDACLVRFNR